VHHDALAHLVRDAARHLERGQRVGLFGLPGRQRLDAHFEPQQLGEAVERVAGTIFLGEAEVLELAHPGGKAQEPGGGQMEERANARVGARDHVLAEPRVGRPARAARIHRGGHAVRQADRVRVREHRLAAIEEVAVQIDEAGRDEPARDVHLLRAPVLDPGRHRSDAPARERHVERGVRPAARVEHPATAEDQLEGHQPILVMSAAYLSRRGRT